MKLTPRHNLAGVAAAFGLASFAAPVFAQGAGGTLTTVAGSIHDVTVDGSGNLLYVTSEGDVGTVTTAGVVTVLVTSGTSGIVEPLRAVVELPGGDVSVIDESGDIWSFPGGSTPAALVYDDLYMVSRPRDMIVDENGTYMMASRTGTAGIRGLNWISSNGAHWGYFLVGHQPIALAADPLGTNILFTDDEFGGALRSTETADPTHPSSPIDTTTLPGFLVEKFDGDIAAELDGDLWMIAGGKVYFRDRVLNTTSLVDSGYAQLTGAAIAASSGGVPSASGWSLYLAEGAAPSTIREIGNVGAPAPLRPANVGTVPSQGIQHLFIPAINCYELSTDADGNLLFGGDNFGANTSVRRIELPSFNISVVAGPADGISGRVEGIQTTQDGIIYAVTTQGWVHRIQESPYQVTTVFDDPFDEITKGKGLVLGRDGSFWIPNYTTWNFGSVYHVDGTGVGGHAMFTEESRGIVADPFHSSFLVTEWNDPGFAGSVGRYDFDTNMLDDLPGFYGMNYTNSGSWPDGDLVMDAEGMVYTISEDDFSVHRYNPATQELVRIGGGYLKHPSGITIAKSTPGSGSTTGWSLWVSEYIWLYELPGTAAPAPTIFDQNAPPVGRHVGYLGSEVGEARAMLADPAGGGFLITTSAGTLVRMDLATGTSVTLAGATEGLSGDLVAIGRTSLDHLIVAAKDGTIFDVDPGASYAATVLFADGLNELESVRGITVDGIDRVLVVDQPAGTSAGKLFRLDTGVLELLARTSGGVRPEIDPVSADIFVTQQGRKVDGGGELLRVDGFQSPATAGHYKGESYSPFLVDGEAGPIAFDGSGNIYVATGKQGRVEFTERSTGVRTTLAGNYHHPVALAVAPGTVGTAGALGNSLFVLDRWSVYEHGIDDFLPPLPPDSQPRSASPADLTTTGLVNLGTTVPIQIDSPADALRIYAVLMTFAGKAPGFPLSIVTPGDDRVIPSNFSQLWYFGNIPGFSPDFISILDVEGKSPPTAGFVVPNDPLFLGLNAFMDLCWFTWDGVAMSGIPSIGGTAHIFFGN